jgi:hypothetical protein
VRYPHERDRPLQKWENHSSSNAADKREYGDMLIEAWIEIDWANP